MREEDLIKEALENKGLIQLEARRSLIVHRAGVIDATFCKKTEINQKEIGTYLNLSDEEVLILAKWACQIEKHYGTPQDIEWAKDGRTKELFIVQSRPETIHNPKSANILEEYQLKTSNQPVLTGIAVGEKIGIGKAKIISNISKYT